MVLMEGVFGSLLVPEQCDFRARSGQGRKCQARSQVLGLAPSLLAVGLGQAPSVRGACRFPESPSRSDSLWAPSRWPIHGHAFVHSANVSRVGPVCVALSWLLGRLGNKVCSSCQVALTDSLVLASVRRQDKVSGIP